MNPCLLHPYLLLLAHPNHTNLCKDTTRYTTQHSDESGSGSSGGGDGGLSATEYQEICAEQVPQQQKDLYFLSGSYYNGSLTITYVVTHNSAEICADFDKTSKTYS